MDILITVPEEREQEDLDELFKMFKIICDNIDTDGLECRQIDIKDVD